MFKQIRTIIVLSVLVSFIGSSIQMPAFAQIDPMPFMPKPGVMAHLSPEYTPAYLKGIVIHPENALKFDFIIYKGDKPLTDAQKREEYTKLTKYFLASLAIPDDDQWVNLSPYEKDRIIKDDFGKTEMGRDLLAQDYLLKQITASLLYPQDSLGKKFWDKVYTQAQKQYGTTNIPVNTFNKVWILPDDALIYEKSNTAYVLKNHLRVMLEEDYLSLQKHSGITSLPKNLSFPNVSVGNPDTKPHSLASQIIKEIVLPELQREVNEGKNFAPLRQVYSGMLLATWFKRTLKQSLLGQIYANKAKVKGVEYSSSSVIASPEGAKQSQRNLSPEQIYQQYLKAYKKGVFNFIKEDTNKYTNETIPRKYFSGGIVEGYDGRNPFLPYGVPKTDKPSLAMITELSGRDDAMTVLLSEHKIAREDVAMTVKDIQDFFDRNINRNEDNLGRWHPAGTRVVQFEIGTTEQNLGYIHNDFSGGLGYRSVRVDQGDHMLYQYTVNPNQKDFSWGPLMLLIQRDLKPTLSYERKNPDFENYLGPRWRQLLGKLDESDAAMKVINPVKRKLGYMKNKVISRIKYHGRSPKHKRNGYELLDELRAELKSNLLNEEKIFLIVMKILEGPDEIWRKQEGAEKSEAEKAFRELLEDIESHPEKWKSGGRDFLREKLLYEFFSARARPRLDVFHRELWDVSSRLGVWVLFDSIRDFFTFYRENTVTDGAYNMSHYLSDNSYFWRQRMIAWKAVGKDKLRELIEAATPKVYEPISNESERAEIPYFFNSDSFPIGPNPFRQQAKSFIGEQVLLLLLFYQSRLGGAVTDFENANDAVIKEIQQFLDAQKEKQVKDVNTLKRGDIVRITFKRRKPLYLVVADDRSRWGRKHLLAFNGVDRFALTRSQQLLYRYRSSSINWRGVNSITKLSLKPDAAANIEKFLKNAAMRGGRSGG